MFPDASFRNHCLGATMEKLFLNFGIIAYGFHHGIPIQLSLGTCQETVIYLVCAPFFTVVPVTP